MNNHQNTDKYDAKKMNMMIKEYSLNTGEKCSVDEHPWIMLWDDDFWWIMLRQRTPMNNVNRRWILINNDE